ncbi:MAG: penicillin-binding protein activator LpoB [Bacteroidetes bacterium]|nr:penicillin-binding protein activator LpoB [Bacteroidota bacterium]
MNKIIVASLGALLLVGSVSCNRKVTRISENKEVDLSGRWNNTDSRLTAEEIIKECNSGKWITNFTSKNPDKKPAVIVGFVKNKSHEHIDAETFMLDLEKSFINQGQVRLIQGGEKRQEIRGERADQQDNASESTMKKFGLEVGADYMLQGDINSIVDSYKNKKVVYYQINLQLTDLQSNEVVWIGDKKITKYVKN